MEASRVLNNAIAMVGSKIDHACECRFEHFQRSKLLPNST